METEPESESRPEPQPSYSGGVGRMGRDPVIVSPA
jgi:hypothetical protein